MGDACSICFLKTFICPLNGFMLFYSFLLCSNGAQSLPSCKRNSIYSCKDVVLLFGWITCTLATSRPLLCHQLLNVAYKMNSERESRERSTCFTCAGGI